MSSEAENNHESRDNEQELCHENGSLSADQPTDNDRNRSSRTTSPHPVPPRLSGKDFNSRPNVNAAESTRSPGPNTDDQLSPGATDRVFPIRSVISVDPAQTPSARQEKTGEGYFHNTGNAHHARRMSAGIGVDGAHSQPLDRSRQTSGDHAPSRRRPDELPDGTRTASGSQGLQQSGSARPQYLMNDIIRDSVSVASERGDRSVAPSERPSTTRALSIKSSKSVDENGPLVTARFKHVVSEGGHAIITGRDGETLQRCEDEPIHIPGAVQGFGLLIALEEQEEGKLLVRIVSENSKALMGYTPRQLFALKSFTDILSEEQADNLLDHVDFIRDEDADVVTNGPEVFTISIRSPQRKTQKFWCAMHVNERNPNLVICEFELEDDPVNPLVPPHDPNAESPEDTLNSQPTEEEYYESTHNSSKPLRVLRSARKRKGEAAAMEVFNIMSQVQEQLAAAPNLDKFLKILVGVVKELTGFHRVMVYQFDQSWNGRVVTELVDPRATKDLYKGLNFPASDIPKQARDLYKINKVRMLYDRDQVTARLVCRTVEDLETPLDLTYSYLRAMSPIHLKYLTNMAVRSSMSISINAFEELWGLIACHSYGGRGMRVSFPIRKMCRLIGDSASRNIERLSYASRLQARKLINTVPTQSNPSGYIIASSEDLLKLFDADFGLLSIRDETKILGHLEHSQEALAMLEYLRMRCITNVMTSQDIVDDFPDLRYPPGFTEIAGLLLVPLSSGGQDFIVFFRKGQLREVKWAGNPYEKYIKEGTEGYLEPRKSFRTWSETVVGKCREWTEEEIETAAVLCLVYGKFIEVWRQKEAALQNSQLTRLLLANSAHEVRTPLNAIINYLEIALEGSLDQETRDNLAKSHSASKSLIYVINDLLDLTKTEEGGDLVKDEVFDPAATLYEGTDMFKGDARRKNIYFEVTEAPNLPKLVIGDQRRVRQAISNVTANAIQSTSEGGVRVDMYVASREQDHVDIEVSIADTGIGMNGKKLDAIFRELEQVQSEPETTLLDSTPADSDTQSEDSRRGESKTLGLGLAVVARIVKNMNGQLRLKSEEGKGSRFVIQFPFDLPDVSDEETKQLSLEKASVEGASESQGSVTPLAEDAGNPIRGSQSDDGMMTLVERSSTQRRVSSDHGRTESMSRKNSLESMGSKISFSSARSGRSTLSKASNRSGKSEADRLIEAISEPHQVEGWYPDSARRSSGRPGSGVSGVVTRPKLEQRHTTSNSRANQAVDPVLPSTGDTESSSFNQQVEGRISKVGQSLVMDSGVPIRPVRVPEDYVSSPSSEYPKTMPAPPVESRGPIEPSDIQPAPASTALDSKNMRVLVAEDDPVNSRIIKKRLEKLGHEVFLTVNGEECATKLCDNANAFDIILMDMQMPIVDGLTSAKMIRSYEKTHPEQLISPRASLNNRIPIIAVSASLIERNRSTYIDGGFDGWILKPISFDRLSEIMEGIVSKSARKANLYRAGRWELGGWFDEARSVDRQVADTTPSDAVPQAATESQAPSEAVEVAAASDNPAVKEDESSEQTEEQQRLLAQQQKGDATADLPGAPPTTTSQPPAKEDAPPSHAPDSASSSSSAGHPSSSSTSDPTQPSASSATNPTDPPQPSSDQTSSSPGSLPAE